MSQDSGTTGDAAAETAQRVRRVFAEKLASGQFDDMTLSELKTRALAETDIVLGEDIDLREIRVNALNATDELIRGNIDAPAPPASIVTIVIIIVWG